MITMEKVAIMTMEETGLMIILKLRWILFRVAKSQLARVVTRQSRRCFQTYNRILILQGIWVPHLHRLRISLLLLRTIREWIFPTRKKWMLSVSIHLSWVPCRSCWWKIFNPTI